MPPHEERPDSDVRKLVEQHIATVANSLSEMTALLKQPGTVTPISTLSADKRTRTSEDEAAPPAKAARSEASTDVPSSAWAGGSLCDIRDHLRVFARERDWDQFHTPRNVCLALVGEVGELAECFQWKGDAGAAEGLPGWAEEKKLHLSEELADVLLYLVRLSDKCGIDLPAAATRKIQRNAAKYPAALVRGSSKKYNEY
mmetsp:Transcript_3527/g.9407  ORF Transcript_3527/g.9407 Transcript_3527/m.9407 type:complete len:200 (+) Transcript_3527:26-625(+)